MNILENEIEDLIFNAITDCPEELINRGLKIYKKCQYFRQVDIGGYGRVDLMGFHISKKVGGYRSIHFHIIEIKKEQIGMGTLTQAVRYCNGFRRLVSENSENIPCSFSISLIGKSIDMNSDFVYFTDIFDDISYYTYSVDLFVGVKFHRAADFLKKNESLPKISKFKDIIFDHLRDQIGWPPVPQLPF